MARTVANESVLKPNGHSAAYRYGMLAILLMLLAFNLWTFAHQARPYQFDPYGNIIMALCLLFNHIAFIFPWGRRIRILFIAVALCWAVFALAYVFYWGRVLFPYPPR